MEKDTIIKIALTALLGLYLAFALPLTGSAERADRYSGVEINVIDSLDSHFVSQADISAECDDLYERISNTSRADINLHKIRKRIAAMPVVEDVNVAALNDGTIRIDVWPMQPVARIFNPHGSGSYYINATGKRVAADVRFHVDVPVVVGDLDRTPYAPTDLLPLLSHIASDRTINALVSTVTTSPRGDIILVPVIRGQFINFGDTSHVADKFARLKTFYTDVIPVKGWNTYDTISVKWAGQIVASLRDKSLATMSLPVEESDFSFVDDMSTMSLDSISNE